MAIINRTGNDYANNLIPCAAGIGAGDGDQERLSLYVTVGIGEMERTMSEIPRGGYKDLSSGKFSLEEAYQVDPAR